jgi:hypothetical protein
MELRKGGIFQERPLLEGLTSTLKTCNSPLSSSNVDTAPCSQKCPMFPVQFLSEIVTIPETIEDLNDCLLQLFI